VKRFRVGLWAVIVSGVLLAGSPAWSQAKRQFSIKVTVAEISNAKGKIDERAERLDRNLRGKFKYNSLRVIQERRLDLAVDEVGSVKLPSGRMFRVQPLNVDERGLLMAVGWEGEVMMDMRAPSNHLLVIGGPTHDDNQLVVSIEPEY